MCWLAARSKRYYICCTEKTQCCREYKVFSSKKKVFTRSWFFFLYVLPGLARSGNVLSSSCCVTNRRLATTKRWCSSWILLWFYGGVPTGSFRGCMQLLAFVLLCNWFYRDCRVHLTSNKALSIHRVCWDESGWRHWSNASFSSEIGFVKQSLIKSLINGHDRSMPGNMRFH